MRCAKIGDPRLEIFWARAAAFVRDTPFLGYGYGRGILRSAFRMHFDNRLKWHGYNMVLNYALEAGMLGVLAIVTLFVTLFHQCWTLYRAPRTGSFSALSRHGAWRLAILVGITIKTVTDDVLVRENALLFWSILGMLCGDASRRIAMAPAEVR